MTARQWLERAKNIEYEIGALRETIQIAKDRLYSVTGKITEDRVQESRANSHEINLYKYMRLKEILNRRIGNLLSIQSEALVTIGKLDNSIYRTVLTERYINGKTIPQIAADIGFTERWTAQLIERAMGELASLRNTSKAV